VAQLSGLPAAAADGPGVAADQALPHFDKFFTREPSRLIRVTRRARLSGVVLSLHAASDSRRIPERRVPSCGGGQLVTPLVWVGLRRLNRT
jgi:hypothetical protein